MALGLTTINLLQPPESVVALASATATAASALFDPSSSTALNSPSTPLPSSAIEAPPTNSQTRLFRATVITAVISEAMLILTYGVAWQYGLTDGSVMRMPTFIKFIFYVMQVIHSEDLIRLCHFQISRPVRVYGSCFLLKFFVLIYGRLNDACLVPVPSPPLYDIVPRPIRSSCCCAFCAF